MPYVVTRSCCNDAACVLACPVNAIHPAPGEPGFAEAEMLYVDPRTCVDCGACATACSVDAIVPHTKLKDSELRFLALGASYFADHPHADRSPVALVPSRRTLRPHEPIRVAVIGAGPAGLFVADELLKHVGVSVDVFDRLPTPYGLVRYGVSPDHPDTRKITGLFRAIERQPGFSYVLGVDVGTDVTLDDLQQHYHAVVYAVGASTPRRLDLEGEDLPGNAAATDLVAWYTGHPEYTDAPVSFDTNRAVVIGGGNVALDVARILTADPDALASTDIADHALAELRGSRVREVVVLSRRGPAEASFTLPELVGLAGLEGVDVVVDSREPIVATDPKTTLLAELAARPLRGDERRIVLRFHSAPRRILGIESVTGVELSDGDVVDAGAVLQAVGHRGRPVAGLPFDDETGTVPNEAGRVRPGVYVAGWIKRGPSGFIGTNKRCAEESVSALLDDLENGLLNEPPGDRPAFLARFCAPAPDFVELAGRPALARNNSVRRRAS